LKNSFRGVSATKFVRKLLNVRSPKTLEFVEITALVPFSTPTGVSATLRLLFARQAKGKRKLVLGRFHNKHQIGNTSTHHGARIREIWFGSTCISKNTLAADPAWARVTRLLQAHDSACLQLILSLQHRQSSFFHGAA
jgi:hypothetical protein